MGKRAVRSNTWRRTWASTSALPSSPFAAKPSTTVAINRAILMEFPPHQSRALCPPACRLSRMPEVTAGGAGSKGMPFLLHVM